MNVKREIRRSFDAAASRYDAVAHIQRRAAEALLARTITPEKGLALDAGCGTGHGLRQLAARGADCIAVDLAPAMARQCGGAACAGDIEALPFRDASFALYWSSLAWQWTRAAAALSEAARVLAEGGMLRVATLGPETLWELRKAFGTVDGHLHVRTFEEMTTYAPLLQAAGFADIRLERLTLTDHATGLRELIERLRTLGADVLGRERRQGLLTPRAWLRLQAAYERFRTTQGLPATYDLILISATRRRP